MDPNNVSEAHAVRGDAYKNHMEEVAERLDEYPDGELLSPVSNEVSPVVSLERLHDYPELFGGRESDLYEKCKEHIKHVFELRKIAEEYGAMDVLAHFIRCNARNIMPQNFKDNLRLRGYIKDETVTAKIKRVYDTKEKIWGLKIGLRLSDIFKDDFKDEPVENEERRESEEDLELELDKLLEGL